MEFYDIALELCADLEKSNEEIEFCANRLRIYSAIYNKTKEEVRELCWEDSTKMFDFIYL